MHVDPLYAAGDSCGSGVPVPRRARGRVPCQLEAWCSNHEGQANRVPRILQPARLMHVAVSAWLGNCCCYWGSFFLSFSIRVARKVLLDLHVQLIYTRLRGCTRYMRTVCGTCTARSWLLNPHSTTISGCFHSKSLQHSVVTKEPISQDLSSRGLEIVRVQSLEKHVCIFQRSCILFIF